jgi:TRAP-type mannitol/chloroaromatic compound transport system substrate-binding protein
MYIDFMHALSVTPVETSPGDIYQALERGVVDGFCWPLVTIRPWGWQEVTKYVVGPTFYKVCHPLLVNVDKWNQIPPDIQKALFLRSFFVLCMPDDFTFNQVNHFFGDVGGMIGHALQVAGD